MELITMKCPNCGANVELDENQETGFCKYCGTKVIKEQPNTQKIKIENPIKIDGKIKIDNSEKFEYQLKQADKYAEGILSKKFLTLNDFFNVYNIYSKTEELDGRDIRVYTHRLDFILKFYIKKPNLITYPITITRYNYMKAYSVSELYKEILNSAIDLEHNEEEKDKLKDIYENKFDKFFEEVNKLNRKNQETRKKKFKKCLRIFFIILVIILLFFVIHNKIEEIERIQREQEYNEAQVFVPNLIGKTVSEAEELLKELEVEYELSTNNPGLNGKNYASTDPDAIVKFVSINSSKHMFEDDDGVTLDRRYEKLKLTAMTKDMINGTGEYYNPKKH